LDLALAFNNPTEGGAGGGKVVATGTPEEVARVKKSYTGQALKAVLK
jgi:excinuclease ABC subunit A